MEFRTSFIRLTDVRNSMSGAVAAVAAIAVLLVLGGLYVYSNPSVLQGVPGYRRPAAGFGNVLMFRVDSSCVRVNAYQKALQGIGTSPPAQTNVQAFTVCSQAPFNFSLDPSSSRIVYISATPPDASGGVVVQVTLTVLSPVNGYVIDAITLPAGGGYVNRVLTVPT